MRAAARILFGALAFLAAAAAPALAAQGSGCMPTFGTVSGLQFAQDVNSGLAAIISSNSGPSAPSTDCSHAPVQGQPWLNTAGQVNVLEIFDGTNWVPLGNLDTVNHIWTPAVAAIQRGYIGGLTLSNDAGNSNTTLDIGAGSATSDDGSTTMALPAATFSKTTASWAVGAGNGALDLGTVGSGLWYHDYLIERLDTLVVDDLLSLTPQTSEPCTVSITSPAIATCPGWGGQPGSEISFQTTGALPAGLLAGVPYYALSTGFNAATGAFQFADSQGGTPIATTGAQSGQITGASAPALPAGYSMTRRIGSVQTDGSANILRFSQRGDEFLWATNPAPQDVNGLAVRTTPLLLQLASVPPGVEVHALITVAIGSTSVRTVLLSSPDQAAITPANSPTGNINLAIAVAGGGASGAFSIRTNTSQQIRAVADSSAGADLWVVTQGYVDSRGKTN